LKIYGGERRRYGGAEETVFIYTWWGQMANNKVWRKVLKNLLHVSKNGLAFLLNNI